MRDPEAARSEYVCCPCHADRSAGICRDWRAPYFLPPCLSQCRCWLRRRHPCRGRQPQSASCLPWSWLAPFVNRTTLNHGLLLLRRFALLGLVPALSGIVVLVVITLLI